MKIGYVIAHDMTRQDGVTKKVLNQVSIWQEAGNEVKLFCFSKNININDEFINYYKIKSGLNFKIQKATQFFLDINKFQPDIVYLRYTSFGLNTYYLLKKYKVITEINTYNAGENYLLFKKEKTIKKLLQYLYSDISSFLTVKYSSAIVSVTYEILNKMNLNNKESIVIPNSISIKNFTSVKERNNKGRIGLFFIGTPNQSWHGVDYIKKLALLLPQYDFHIIGMDETNTNNLYWHGYISQVQYLKIIKKCHIGIGSLALFRNNMVEACPLKVREYISYGFPVIIGYEETAFKLYDETPDWALNINVKNLENEIKKIIEFIEKNKNNILNKNKIAKYIDSSILEMTRINFFKRV